MYNDIDEKIDEVIHGGYNYLNQDELESLLDKAEDLLTVVKRALRDKEKYR